MASTTLAASATCTAARFIVLARQTTAEGRQAVVAQGILQFLENLPHRQITYLWNQAVRERDVLDFRFYGLRSGLARVLSYQSGEHLVAGRLQTVLADFEQEPLPIQIVHSEVRRASAKVRAFINLAVDRLRANRLIN